MGNNRHSAKHRRKDLLVGGAGFLGAFVLALLWPTTPAPEQPILYNHQKHLDAGLECANCHTLFADSPWAGLPPAETCAMCHQATMTESPEEARLIELLENGAALEWKQVNQLPTHVYFSHQTHAVAAEMDCAVCHGEMQERTVPPTEPFFAWTMDACMDCHEQQNATLDCNGCHR